MVQGCCTVVAGFRSKPHNHWVFLPNPGGPNLGQARQNIGVFHQFQLPQSLRIGTFFQLDSSLMSWPHIRHGRGHDDHVLLPRNLTNLVRHIPGREHTVHHCSTRGVRQIIRVRRHHRHFRTSVRRYFRQGKALPP